MQKNLKDKRSDTEKNLEWQIKDHISRLNRLPINTGPVTEAYLLQ